MNHLVTDTNMSETTSDDVLAFMDLVGYAPASETPAPSFANAEAEGELVAVRA